MLTRLRSRALLLVAVVTLLPLSTLGAIAIARARRTLLDEAERSNRDLALRAAAEIERQVERFEDTLAKLTLVLAPSTRVSMEQAQRILRSYRIETRELLALDYLGADGRESATGRLDDRLGDRGDEEAVRAALAGRVYRSAVRLSDDLVPEMTLAVPQRSGGQVVGAMVARVDLTELWALVDKLRVGETGYARVVGGDGTLIAIGDNPQKRRVFTREKDSAQAVVGPLLAGRPLAVRYLRADGEEVLAVGVPIEGLGWGLILEQPVREALAPYLPFRATLFALSVVLLGIAALLGWLGARSVVEPIERLRLRAGEIARGLLEARVEVRAPEELAALAAAMNTMSAELIRLQDDLRKKERIATLGRLAAGLAHDLKHPVRILQVNARLVMERPQDPEVRRLFSEVVHREFRKLEGFLEDLKRVSRGGAIDFAREPLDAGALLADFAAELGTGVAPALVKVEQAPADGPLPIAGSRELLSRVLANLASNAFEAMEGEGRLRLSATAAPGARTVELRVSDSGPGIAPERLPGLFSDFETTKRRGLGLGLAVCKKIVEDHGGSIAVESVVGQGAAFVIRLPRAPG